MSLLKRFLPLGALVLVLSTTCFADSVTYTYTGTNFRTITCNVPPGCSNPPVSTSNAVTAFFTLDSPLGPFFGPVTPTNWAMSDGLTTLSPANAVLQFGGFPILYSGQLFLDLDAAGNILHWEMAAKTPAAASLNTAACLAGTETCISIVTFHEVFGDPNTITEDTSFYYPYGGGSTSTSTSADGVPGSWTRSTTTTVAEPFSLVLLVTSLAGVFAGKAIRNKLSPRATLTRDCSHLAEPLHR